MEKNQTVPKTNKRTGKQKEPRYNNKNKYKNNNNNKLNNKNNYYTKKGPVFGD